MVVVCVWCRVHARKIRINIAFASHSMRGTRFFTAYRKMSVDCDRRLSTVHQMQQQHRSTRKQCAFTHFHGKHKHTWRNSRYNIVITWSFRYCSFSVFCVSVLHFYWTSPLSASSSLFFVVACVVCDDRLFLFILLIFMCRFILVGTNKLLWTASGHSF